MTIWIVSEHWHYETGDVRGVYDSLAKAMAHVKPEIKNVKARKEARLFDTTISWDCGGYSWQIEKWEIK